MAVVMKSVAAVSVLAAVCFSVLYNYTGEGVFLSLAITFGTIAYHFCMRLAVGLIFNASMKNRADYTKKWFRVGASEIKLYNKLKVKKWKDKMPTYDTDAFDTTKHSRDELGQVMCQSELVHETIFVLSFLPIIAVVWFGEPLVFIITSVVAATVDLMFVMMQRYNRSRIIRMINKAKRK